MPQVAAREGWWSLFCDGGARGNPGPAGAGAVLLDPAGGQAAALSRYLGVATNNLAEYQGLIMGLEEALAQGARELRVFADSELMVRQLNGQYQVKSPHLKPLHQKARALLARFARVEVGHVRREENSAADRLANQAMDRRG